MTFGILGTGSVGAALARGLVARGHTVILGTRDPAKPALQPLLAELGARASAATFAEAARRGDLLILATHWGGTEAVLAQVGEGAAGKIVLDATNPIAREADGTIGLAVGGHDSAGELVQRALPTARVVKALNWINAHHMVDPDFPLEADFFLAGDDAGAKAEVADLARALGWRSIVDTGPLRQARYLEPLAMLYITLSFADGNWNRAWKLMQRE